MAHLASGKWLRVGALAGSMAMLAGLCAYWWSSSERGSPEADRERDFAEVALSMRFIPFEGGTFLMGSLRGENDEKPPHRVRVSRFELSQTEVTQAQWEAVMEANPSHCFRAGCTDDQPVQKVSWNEAVLFLNRLSERAGRQPCYQDSDDGWSWLANCNGYRLPTEAEWEFACRAGRTDASGNEVLQAELDTYARYGRAWDDGTLPVRSLQPNTAGLHDMRGNVWEWVWDWYGLYGDADQVDPTGPNKRRAAFVRVPQLDRDGQVKRIGKDIEWAKGKAHVLKGGSYFSKADAVRCAHRDGSGPFVRGRDFGFRVARTPD